MKTETLEKFNVDGTLEKIRDLKYSIIFAPFHGTPVPVMVRELTDTQIKACGDFSLIETFQDKIRMKKKLKIRELVAFAERNHNISKAALISPTYEQIFKEIGIEPQIKEKLKEIEELKKELRKTKSGPQRSSLEESLDNMRIWIYYLLPEDFTTHITCYALGIDKTDIKLVTRKMLLDAAILATNGHDNPADHIDGLFTAFNKDDINRRAWIIYADHIKENSNIKPKRH